MGASCLEIEGFDNLAQDKSIPMTEQAISPLRRRMIEDMSIRRFAAKTQHDYVQRGTPKINATVRRCGSSSRYRLIAPTSSSTCHTDSG
jgi:hypothetical protein